MSARVALFAAYLTFCDGTRTTYYLSWVAPLYGSCLAWAVMHYSSRGGWRQAFDAPGDPALAAARDFAKTHCYISLQSEGYRIYQCR